MVEKAVWEIGKFVLNKGQSGAGGRTFNDKILFKGFREGEKYVYLGKEHVSFSSAQVFVG